MSLSRPTSVNPRIPTETKTPLMPSGVPFAFDIVKMKVGGELHNLAEHVEAFIPTLKPHFMLRFFISDAPVMKELVETYGKLPDTHPIHVELEGDVMKMTGLCTYEVEDFVMHEGVFLVLPVRFTWTRREVEIK